ncbi:MAG: hypothetical protein GY788_29700 [bacterium]|nr:hypothetical protein [bacterium]
MVPTIGDSSSPDPDKHWRAGRSASLLAHAWEGADGFPAKVVEVLEGSDLHELEGLEMVAAFPRVADTASGQFEAVADRSAGTRQKLVQQCDLDRG